MGIVAIDADEWGRARREEMRALSGADGRGRMKRKRKRKMGVEIEALMEEK